jgi:hypothetical protein
MAWGTARPAMRVFRLLVTQFPSHIAWAKIKNFIELRAINDFFTQVLFIMASTFLPSPRIPRIPTKDQLSNQDSRKNSQKDSNVKGHDC